MTFRQTVFSTLNSGFPSCTAPLSLPCKVLSVVFLYKPLPGYYKFSSPIYTLYQYLYILKYAPLQITYMQVNTHHRIYKSCITHRHLFRHMVQTFQAYRHLLTCNISHHCVNDLSQKIPVTIPSVEKILYDIVHLETILHSWCTFPYNSLVTAPYYFNFSKE